MQFMKYTRITSSRGVSRLRFLIGSACLMIAAFTGVAAAQSPVAYVYVGENATQTPFNATSAFAASSDGKLTEIKGSPFTQTTNIGYMLATNGTHFIFVGPDPNNLEGLMKYLYSYKVEPDGGVGQQVSAIDTQLYGGADCTPDQGYSAPEGVEMDHTGQYLYVPYCTDAVQTYKIAKSGELTFQNAAIYNNVDYGGGLPKLAGNSTFAYNQALGENYTYTFAAYARESDGSLVYAGIPTVTGPSLPEGDYPSFSGLITDDPTDHFAVMLQIFRPSESGYCALASYTVGSQGHLTSTNNENNMPALPDCGQAMLLSPNGKFLVVLPNGQRSLQFFHFNGADPITPLDNVIGKSGWFATMAWDSSNHLYVLNGLSGRLHVYTVSSSSVVEASGSPYDVPFCGYDFQDQVEGCMQNLVVRSIP